MATDMRVERLELEVESLGRRLERLEAEAQTAVPVSETPAVAPAVRLTPDPATSVRWAPPVAAAPLAPPRPTQPQPKAASPRRASPFAGLKDDRSLEDVLGGRVLAWLGGVAVLIGVAFLFAVAVSRGWIDEAARTLVAGSGSAALLALGVYLFEKRGRSDSALAAVATGVSALFVTFTVAAQVYELIPPALALLMAVGVGSLATALAVRWEAQGIAALGIVGALASPVLAGAPADLGTLAMLLVAAASAAAVLVRERWEWLAFALFFVPAPQWLSYVLGDASVAGALLVLTGFGAVGAAAAVGYEIRTAAQRLSTTSAFLLGLNALVLALAGWLALEGQGADTLGRVWLAALAIAHLGVGVATRRSERIAHDFGLLALVIGVVVADVAFALAVEGPARAVGFAGASVLFAALLRRRGMPVPDAALSVMGLGVHVSIALTQALGDSPPELLEGTGLPAAGAVAGLLAVASACFVSARLADTGHAAVRTALDAVGLAVTAYLTALTLEGVTLVLVWSAEAVALAHLGSRRSDLVAAWGARAHVLLGLGVTCGTVVSPVAILGGETGSALASGAGGALASGTLALGASALAAAICARLAGPAEREVSWALDGLALGIAMLALALVFDGALLVLCLAGLCVALAEAARLTGQRSRAWAAAASLGVALIHTLALEAPPSALVQGLADPGAAAVALVATVVAALAAARSGEWWPRWREALAGTAALSTLFLASVLVVTPFSSPEGMDGLAALGTRQQGQVLLSALWSVVGVGALVAGLRRDLQILRLAALALLLATVAKVFLYDLATLTSIYRVVSFVALGLLLLLAGFVWERMRPRPAPDMREVPDGVR